MTLLSHGISSVDTVVGTRTEGNVGAVARMEGMCGMIMLLGGGKSPSIVSTVVSLS